MAARCQNEEGKAMTIYGYARVSTNPPKKEETKMKLYQVDWFINGWLRGKVFKARNAREAVKAAKRYSPRGADFRVYAAD
jgi:hypothetical protein